MTAGQNPAGQSSWGCGLRSDQGTQPTLLSGAHSPMDEEKPTLPSKQAENYEGLGSPELKENRRERWGGDLSTCQS